jgi:branched-subunit amino acid transport protein
MEGGMSDRLPWIIAGMMLVTYFPRYLPLVLRSSRTPRPWQRQVLSLVPFAAIGALLIPDGFHSVEGDVLLSSVGLIVATVVAVFARKPIIVVVAAVLGVIIFKWLGLSGG